jgi:hypothetical protein
MKDITTGKAKATPKFTNPVADVLLGRVTPPTPQQPPNPIRDQQRANTRAVQGIVPQARLANQGMASGAERKAANEARRANTPGTVENTRELVRRQVTQLPIPQEYRVQVESLIDSALHIRTTYLDPATGLRRRVDPLASGQAIRETGMLDPQDAMAVVELLKTEEGIKQLQAEVQMFRDQRVMGSRRARGTDQNTIGTNNLTSAEQAEILAAQDAAMRAGLTLDQFLRTPAGASMDLGNLRRLIGRGANIGLLGQAQAEGKSLEDPTFAGLGAVIDRAAEADPRIAGARQFLRQNPDALTQGVEGLERASGMLGLGGPIVEATRGILSVVGLDTDSYFKALDQFNVAGARGVVEGTSAMVRIPQLLGSQTFADLANLADAAVATRDKQKPLDQTFFNEMGRVIGGVIPQVAPALLTGGGSAGASAAARIAASVAFAVTEAGANAAGGYNKAIQKGENPMVVRRRVAQAMPADIIWSAVLNRLGEFGEIGEAFAKAGRKSFADALKAGAVRYGSASALEGIQEGGQTILEHYIATGEIDPSRPEVLKSMLLGAAVGGAMKGALDLAPQQAQGAEASTVQDMVDRASAQQFAPRLTAQDLEGVYAPDQAEPGVIDRTRLAQAQPPAQEVEPASKGGEQWQMTAEEWATQDPDVQAWERTKKIVDEWRKDPARVGVGIGNFDDMSRSRASSDLDAYRGYARFIDTFFNELPADLQEWWMRRPDYLDAEDPRGTYVSVLDDGVHGTHVFNAWEQAAERRDTLEDSHRAAVVEAFFDGKPVPERVLQQHPDLLASEEYQSRQAAGPTIDPATLAQFAQVNQGRAGVPNFPASAEGIVPQQAERFVTPGGRYSVEPAPEAGDGHYKIVDQSGRPIPYGETGTYFPNESRAITEAQTYAKVFGDEVSTRDGVFNEQGFVSKEARDGTVSPVRYRGFTEFADTVEHIRATHPYVYQLTVRPPSGTTIPSPKDALVALSSQVGGLIGYQSPLSENDAAKYSLELVASPEVGSLAGASWKRRKDGEGRIVEASVEGGVVRFNGFSDTATFVPQQAQAQPAQAQAVVPEPKTAPEGTPVEPNNSNVSLFTSKNGWYSVIPDPVNANWFKLNPHSGREINGGISYRDVDEAIDVAIFGDKMQSQAAKKRGEPEVFSAFAQDDKSKAIEANRQRRRETRINTSPQPAQAQAVEDDGSVRGPVGKDVLLAPVVSETDKAIKIQVRFVNSNAKTGKAERFESVWIPKSMVNNGLIDSGFLETKLDEAMAAHNRATKNAASFNDWRMDTASVSRPAHITKQEALRRTSALASEQEAQKWIKDARASLSSKPPAEAWPAYKALLESAPARIAETDAFKQEVSNFNEDSSLTSKYGKVQIQPAQPSRLGQVLAESQLPAPRTEARTEKGPATQEKEPWQMTRGETRSRRITKSQMIAQGADGYLSEAVLLDIPVSKVEGREPTPDMEGGYEQFREITQPIEVAYDAGSGTFTLYSGNHRITQAEANGQKTIKAFVEGYDHKGYVEQALKDGLPVPPEVLADYPDLAAKYAPKPAQPSRLGQVLAESQLPAPRTEARTEKAPAVTEREVQQDAVASTQTTPTEAPAAEDSSDYPVRFLDLLASAPKAVREVVYGVKGGKQAERNVEAWFAKQGLEGIGPVARRMSGAALGKTPILRRVSTPDGFKPGYDLASSGSGGNIVRGVFAGKAFGRPIWGNTAVLLFGKPPASAPLFPKGFQQPNFERVVPKDYDPSPLRLVAQDMAEKSMPAILATDDLSGIASINPGYYALVSKAYPKATWHQAGGSLLVAVQGGKIVAVVAPLNAYANHTSRGTTEIYAPHVQKLLAQPAPPVEKALAPQEPQLAQPKAPSLRVYDDEGEFNTVQDLLAGLNDGRLLVHIRVKDGTDFKYGIDPSAGDFLRRTEAWQTAVDEFGEGPELTFFADSLTWAENNTLSEVRGGGEMQAVFVRKSDSIQKSLGGGKVLTADGKTVSYEMSPLADHESNFFRGEPAGVETGDWYTNASQDVVAVVDVADLNAPATQEPQLAQPKVPAPELAPDTARAMQAKQAAQQKRELPEGVVEVQTPNGVRYAKTTEGKVQFGTTLHKTPEEALADKPIEPYKPAERKPAPVKGAKLSGAELAAAGAKARAEKSLSSTNILWRKVDGTEQVGTLREHADYLLSIGAKPAEARIEDDAAIRKARKAIEANNRRSLDNYSPQIDKANKAILQNPPTKAVYRAMKGEDRWTVITKAQYDYMVAKAQETPQPAQETQAPAPKSKPVAKTPQRLRYNEVIAEYAKSRGSSVFDGNSPTGRITAQDAFKQVQKEFSWVRTFGDLDRQAPDILASPTKPAKKDTITVDGKERPRLNSNGNPIHPTDQGIINFWRWFGDSKVVDEQGRPLVVYHGGPRGIDRFIPSFAKTNGDMFGTASYFTSSKQEAARYAKEGEVYEVYLRGDILDLSRTDLPSDAQSRLTRLGKQVMKPYDKARFAQGRKSKVFRSVEDASAFLDRKEQEFKTQGGGVRVAQPQADLVDGSPSVAYTDFDAEIAITTGSDAMTLLQAVGFNNVLAAKFDGVIIAANDNTRWFVMHDPDRNVKSATGNQGTFSPSNPSILASPTKPRPGAAPAPMVPLTPKPNGGAVPLDLQVDPLASAPGARAISIPEIERAIDDVYGRTHRGTAAKGADGSYSVSSGARWVRDGKFLVGIHEAGHQTSYQAQVIPHFTGPAMDELRSGYFDGTIPDNASQDTADQERFAEFFLAWHINPKLAGKVAPTLRKEFEAIMDAHDRALFKKMNDLSRLIRAYQGQNDVQLAAANFIPAESQSLPSKIAKALKSGTWEKVKDNLGLRLTDEYYPVLAAIDRIVGTSLRKGRELLGSKNPETWIRFIPYTSELLNDGLINGMVDWGVSFRTGKLTRSTGSIKDLFAPLKPKSPEFMSNYTTALGYIAALRQVHYDERLKMDAAAQVAEMQPKAAKKLADRIALAHAQIDRDLQIDLTNLAVQGKATKAATKTLIDAADARKDRATKALTARSKAGLTRYRNMVLKEAAATAARSGIVAPGANGRTATDIAKGALASIASDPETKAMVEAFAAEIRRHGDWQLSMMEHSGRLSMEQAERIRQRNPYWFPIDREMSLDEDLDEALGFVAGQKIGNAKNVIREFKGSQKSMSDVVGALVKRNADVLAEFHRNMAARTMVDWVEDRGAIGGKAGVFHRVPTEVGIKPKDTQFFVWRNGEKETWEADPGNTAFVAAIKSFSGPRMEDKWERVFWMIFETPTQVNKAFVTNSLPFMVRNLWRDTVHASIKLGLNPIDVFRPKSDFVNQNYDALAIGLGRSTDIVSKSKWERNQAQMIKKASSEEMVIVRSYRVADDLRQESERTPRKAVFDREFKKHMATGNTEVESALMATMYTRNGMTDFRQGGTTVRALSRIVMFLNASVQGTRASLRAYRDDPVRTSLALAKYAGIWLAAEAAWAALGGEDEEKRLEQLDGYQRDMFWNFRVGGDNGWWLTIPKGHDEALGVGIIQRLALRVAGKDASHLQNTRNLARDTVLPMDDASDLFGGWLPSVELGFNRDWRTGKEIVPFYDQGPVHERSGTGYASTLGQALQRAFGNKVDARQWDHLIENSFGYYGRVTTSGSDSLKGGDTDALARAGIRFTGLNLPGRATNNATVLGVENYLRLWSKRPQAWSDAKGAFFDAKTEAERQEAGRKLIALAEKWHDKFESIKDRPKPARELILKTYFEAFKTPQ